MKLAFYYAANFTKEIVRYFKFFISSKIQQKKKKVICVCCLNFIFYIDFIHAETIVTAASNHKAHTSSTSLA